MMMHLTLQKKKKGTNKEANACQKHFKNTNIPLVFLFVCLFFSWRVQCIQLVLENYINYLTLENTSKLRILV